MNNLAESYQAVGRHAEALKLYEETLTLAKAKLPRNHPKTLLVMNNLAWLLATAADVRFRNADRAVELAEQAARGSPADAGFTGTLGTARYRAGQWDQAARDLEQAIRLRGADNSVNANESFFLAMARWRLGDQPGARDWFKRGVDWMKTGKSRDDEVRRFRAEAAEMLGIEPEADRPGGPTAK
jgi:tetratricopeptide (TPR) repeat protein